MVSNPARLTTEEYVHPIIAHYRIVIWILAPVYIEDARVYE